MAKKSKIKYPWIAIFVLYICKENDILREDLSKKEKEVEGFMLEMFTEEELEEMRRKYEERERKEQFENGKEIGEKVVRKIIYDRELYKEELKYKNSN